VSFDATVFPSMTLDEMARVREIFDTFCESRVVRSFIQAVVESECNRRNKELAEPKMVAVPVFNWGAKDLCEFVRLVRHFENRPEHSTTLQKFFKQSIAIGIPAMAGRLQAAEERLYDR
jgi:hypothetical protein